MSSRQGIEELRWVGALVGLAVIAAVGALVVGDIVCGSGGDELDLLFLIERGISLGSGVTQSGH